MRCDNGENNDKIKKGDGKELKNGKKEEIESSLIIKQITFYSFCLTHKKY